MVKLLKKFVAVCLIAAALCLCAGCELLDGPPTTYPTYPSMNQNPILTKPSTGRQDILASTAVVVSYFGEVAIVAQTPVAQWENKQMIATPKGIVNGGRIGGVDGLGREMVIKKVVIATEVVPNSTRDWFRDMPDLTEIVGLNLVRTDRVTDMSNMFNGCPRIEQLNISEWNVSRVKNMTGMFDGCNSLRRLPNWYKETEETK